MKIKSIKSIITFFLIISIILSTAFFAIATEDKDSTAEQSLPIEISAKSAILMDVETGAVLLKKNEHEKLYPASVTKIMSMLLIVEAIDSKKIALDDVVTASEDACKKGGSQIWLEPGEQMTVDELLKATAVGSANDACTALGELVAGSEEGFVAMMNKRAKELGMNDTHFDNCTGLDDTTETHLTSAYDIAVMSKELIKHDTIRKYTTIWMDTLRNGETELTNTNKLVRFYSGTTGLKTGTTSKAGHCLSATAQREGLHLVAVVLGCDNSANRFGDAKKMLNWGFSNYTLITPEIDHNLIKEVKVIGGITKSIKPEILKLTPVLVKKNQKDTLSQNIELCESIQAPVEKNQVLGTIKISVDNKEIAEYQLVSSAEVKKINIFDAFILLLKVYRK